MIGGALVLCLLVTAPVGEREIAELLASSLSTPRLTLTSEAAAGLTGRAFLSVAGPQGALQVEPWLFIARLPWLFRAQGWESRLLYNGCVSWEEARQSIIVTGAHHRPAVWVWVGEGGDEVWGWGTREPPSEEGCFVAVVGDRAVDPQPPASTVSTSLLEALSWTHAATTSGLSGLEPREDPYTAQGFGAYKRLYADISEGNAGRRAELAEMVSRWAERRRQAGGFLRWAATYLPEHERALDDAAVFFEQEAMQCLDPLTALLAGEKQEPGGAPELLWRGLSWYIKAMQTLEPVAFSSAGLDSGVWRFLHAPDEEPVPPADVGHLLQLSGHRNVAVRRIALRKLGGVSLEYVDIPLLIAALRDDDALVQQAALAALEAARPSDLRRILWEAYEVASPAVLHGNGPFQRALVLALTRVREAEVPGLLATAGATCIPGDCRPRSQPTWCAEGIVDLLGQASWPYLQVMLHASCPYSREAAAVALGRLGLEETQSELHAIAFRDSSTVVRCAALGALGRMGSEEAVHELIELAGSPDPEIRVAAAAGLVEAGDIAMPLIAEWMKHASPELSRVLNAVRAAHRHREARKLLTQ
jgi:hypothetical protein